MNSSSYRKRVTTLRMSKGKVWSAMILANLHLHQRERGQANHSSGSSESNAAPRVRERQRKRAAMPCEYKKKKAHLPR